MMERLGIALPKVILLYFALPLCNTCIQVYALETVVCNRHYGYAGTADCIARCDITERKLALVQSLARLSRYATLGQLALGH